ncbi:MAG: response regulator [Burkholderiaceae bacterium]
MMGSSIRVALQGEGYLVDMMQDSRAVSEVVLSEHFDLLLLDRGVPNRSGLDILQDVRAARKAIPVIVITVRDGIEDRVTGLDLGADDYLVKPFSARELAARIRSVPRRSCGRPGLEVDMLGMHFNMRQRQVMKNGEPVILSAKEYAVVETLIQRLGVILSRAQFDELLYGWGEEVESNAVLVHIHAARQKLGTDFMRTLRRVGYFVPEPGSRQ